MHQRTLFLEARKQVLQGQMLAGFQISTGSSRQEILILRSPFLTQFCVCVCVYVCGCACAYVYFITSSAEPNLNKMRLYCSHWPHLEDPEKTILISFSAVESCSFFYLEDGGLGK